MKTVTIPKFIKRFLIASASLIALMLIALVGVAASSGQSVIANTTTYYYDVENETWIKDIESVSLPDNPDGSKPKPSNTVIIRLDANNPVKQIVVLDGLVMGGTEPILEIAGHDTGGSGELNIGTLLLKKVDANRLDFDNTDAVDVQMSNVVAQDNELDMDVDVVNVVRAGRGGPSSLFIGATRSVLYSILDLNLIPDNFVPPNETGVRIDRLRILGPSSGDAFVERIVILHSSVFGTINVKDVNIHDIILQDVTLDDSSP